MVLDHILLAEEGIVAGYQDVGGSFESSYYLSAKYGACMTAEQRRRQARGVDPQVNLVARRSLILDLVEAVVSADVVVVLDVAEGVLKGDSGLVLPALVLHD